MKIRLHGTIEELNEAIVIIKANFIVVSISKAYKNRGGSLLHRVYVEVRI